jgi:hypothetical protein
LHRPHRSSRRHTDRGSMKGNKQTTVAACVYNRNEETVSIQRLLYIGEAANIHDRIANHERWADWRRQLQSGEVLCLNAALVSGQNDRCRAEAAMIFSHKPPCNTEYRNSFPFNTTSISTTGSNTLMKPSLTAYRTQYRVVSAFARQW